MMAQDSIQMHGSAVAYDGIGVLIIGASGSGKSSLAAGLIALGADLVADDQVCLKREDGKLTASAPETLAGLCEHRGIGVLKLPYAAEAEVRLVVDLDVVEVKRLPDKSYLTILDIKLPQINAKELKNRTAAVKLCLLAIQFSGSSEWRV